jgi:hypothetical protein
VRAQAPAKEVPMLRLFTTVVLSLFALMLVLLMKLAWMQPPRWRHP